MAKQAEMFGDSHKNPKLYRKLCEPYESPAAAGEALEKFWDEVYELRAKYKIPDMLIVMSFAVQEDNGEETDRMGMLYAGDNLKKEAIAAFAHGRATSEREQIIGRALKGART